VPNCSAEADLINGIVYYATTITPQPSSALTGMFPSSAQLPKPTGLANFGYYANPEMDRRMNEAQATLDRKRSMELRKRVNALLIEDAAALFLHRLVFQDFVRADVAGFEPVPYKLPNYVYYYSLHRAK
jgi:ABC-type transport system substrate-binding protein